MSPELQNTLLAVLFAVGDPISPEKLAEPLGLDAACVAAALTALQEKLEEEGSPFELLQLESEYQLATREKYTPVIKSVLAERRNTSLSSAAMEVLATVAFNQPVTRAYIEHVRGVDSSGVVTSLVEKQLIEEAGRLDLPGRPITYRTTAHFLRTFGLSSLDELSMALESDCRELVSRQNEDFETISMEHIINNENSKQQKRCHLKSW